MPTLQAQRTRCVFLTLLLSVVILLLASLDAVDAAANSNTYQRNRVYEQRSAQYVNPAVVRQQLEQRKHNAEIAWQRQLAEIARLRRDAELRARDLQLRNKRNQRLWQ